MCYQSQLPRTSPGLTGKRNLKQLVLILTDTQSKIFSSSSPNALSPVTHLLYLTEDSYSYIALPFSTYFLI